MFPGDSQTPFFIPQSTPIMDTPVFQPQVNKVLPSDSAISNVVVDAHVLEPQSSYAFRKNRNVKLRPQSNIKINMKNIQKFKSPLQSVPAGKSKTLSLLSKTENLDAARFVAQLVMNERQKWMPTSIPAKVLYKVLSDITNSISVFTLEPQPKHPDPCDVINVLISDTTGFDLVLSAVSAKPSLAGKHVLWNFLDGCGFYASHPWLLLGDFNNTVFAGKRSNPLVVDSTNHVLSWINRNCLIDLGFPGPKFTWTNGRKGRALIRKRLDKVLCNSDWRVHFE
ncbi:Endonuclease/exonuclease/phosphatase [Quillaja saponaria]|uniref:Endonuclease/exonuclease/phosphatase n=1 Tax=Quillaja saponaria TaxID=32244 RepID=A0AAD7VDP8_QUISA|nr:Endonuclease/exonuclease/phosphatase [Quillaja saponaria]